MQEVAVLASRVLTTKREFTAVADNVANVNTEGFRKLALSFQEVTGKGGSNAASYVQDRALLISQAQGALENTGNPLDVAINGTGFFATREGANTVYTRRGRFVVDGEGTLSTPEGNPVLDNAGATIQFPEDVKTITIGPDGTISTEQGQIAQLGIYEFNAKDLAGLQRVGTAGFLPPKGATPTAMDLPVVKQGFLEASNVNPVEEMVNMQNVSKAYESSLRMLRSIEDLEQRAIRNIGVAQ